MTKGGMNFGQSTLVWRQESEYHLAAANYTIARCKVQSDWRYVLWLGRESLGIFDSADEAKAAAAQRDLEELAGAA